jgi:hypothetical protein
MPVPKLITTWDTDLTIRVDLGPLPPACQASPRGVLELMNQQGQLLDVQGNPVEELALPGVVVWHNWCGAGGASIRVLTSGAAVQEGVPLYPKCVKRGEASTLTRAHPVGAQP